MAASGTVVPQRSTYHTAVSSGGGEGFGAFPIIETEVKIVRGQDWCFFPHGGRGQDCAQRFHLQILRDQQDSALNAWGEAEDRSLQYQGLFVREEHEAHTEVP